MKQILVIRTDLRNVNGNKCRSGKILAQSCHASLKIFSDGINWNTLKEVDSDNYEVTLNLKKDSVEWLKGLFTKIAVAVNSEDELKQVYAKAIESGVQAALITDAGLTEFGGVPTLTCCSVGPASDDKLKDITGHLKLF